MIPGMVMHDPGEKAGETFVAWFRAAAPYIHEHSGKTFVVFLDGELVAAGLLPALAYDLALLDSLGIRLVLVPGVRPQVEALLRARGHDSRYVRDLRITDGDALECVKRAAGLACIELQAMLSMGLPNTPMAGAAVRTAYGNWATARPVGIIDGTDCGYTGKLRRLDQEAVRLTLARGDVVLLPPLGYSLTGEVFNLHAKELALEAACALRADKLIFLLPGGLRGSDDERVRELNMREAETLLQRTPAAERGNALQCLALGVDACKRGVERVHIVDQAGDGALLVELFSLDGAATLLTADTYDALCRAGVEHVGGILELIRPLEQAGVLAPRPRDLLERELDRFLVAVRDGMVIACAALKSYPEVAMAEIECLAVSPAYHGRSQGERLYHYLEEEARRAGADKVFVLTTQTEHWFLERGFVAADVEALPACCRHGRDSGRNSRVLVKTLQGE